MKSLLQNNFNILRIQKYGKKIYAIGFSIFRILLLLSIGFVILYPLFYMIVTSLVGKAGFLNSSRIWIPNQLAVATNYKFAFEILDYGNALWSTFKNHVLSALIEVCSCAFIAYGFARFQFKGKKVLVFLLLLTIMVPDMMILIPRAVNYSRLDFLGIGGLIYKLTGFDIRLDIINTSWTFWLPSIFGIGLRSGILIYIYMQFFQGLPKELEEAAYVDGANSFRTFLSIAVPSSGVVILTVTVFSLIWHWNDFHLSGMYLYEELPLARQLAMMPELMGSYGVGVSAGARNPEGMAYQMACCVLFILPMLIFYMIIQHWFIESIDRVGITG